MRSASTSKRFDDGSHACPPASRCFVAAVERCKSARPMPSSACETSCKISTDSSAPTHSHTASLVSHDAEPRSSSAMS